MYGAAVGQLDIELPRLNASAPGVAGAQQRVGGLLPDDGHKRIVRLFGEEQSMPDKRVGFFVPPQNCI
jgi:hypothetical protein